MKFIPILFSTPMVQAIQDGRKTQTRRVVKPQFAECKHELYEEAPWKNEPSNFIPDYNNKDYYYCEYCGNGVSERSKFMGTKCPYGQPGDVLWVRETFTIIDYWVDMKSLHVMYEDGVTDLCVLNNDEWAKFIKWKEKEGRKSSLFMFRSLSRLFLKVKSVRVERLQDISEADAKAEGALGVICQVVGDACGAGYTSYVEGFYLIWQKINGRESWDANPWVWVVEFEKIEKPAEFLF